MQKDTFSGKWGIIIAGLGMAIGTGNIWRFPRMAAQYGGGSFLIPWIIFLFSWSIPLLIIEMAMGRSSKGGVVKAFHHVAGGRFAWLGVFVAAATTGIAFYYGVVSGWCMRYFAIAVIHGPSGKETLETWNHFAFTGNSLFFFVGTLALSMFILFRGIRKGIERMSKVILPVLLIIFIICTVRALTLPGGTKGLAYLFSIKPECLSNHLTWLEALAQSAWSTGAGMALLLTYAAYYRKKDHILTEAVSVGVGNNIASIIAAIVIIPTVYGILSAADADKVMAEGSTGLVFIWLPQLFGKMGGGRIFMIFFFAALYFASLTSLVALMELPVLIFTDFGLPRKKAVWFVFGLCFLFGIPSALSSKYFDNQDWTWGVGLILSGLLIVAAVIKHGVENFRKNSILSGSRHPVLKSWFNWIIVILIPVQFLGLMGWLLFRSIRQHPDTWWHPHGMSVGTCIFQWGLILLIAFLFRKKISLWLTRNNRIN